MEEVHKPNINKYHTLINDLREMIDRKSKGYDTAQTINNEFWEELSTHRERMLEQIERLENTKDEAFETELATADSIYEAARSHLAKF